MLGAVAVAVAVRVVVEVVAVVDVRVVDVLEVGGAVVFWGALAVVVGVEVARVPALTAPA